MKTPRIRAEVRRFCPLGKNIDENFVSDSMWNDAADVPATEVETTCLEGIRYYAMLPDMCQIMTENIMVSALRRKVAPSCDNYDILSDALATTMGARMCLHTIMGPLVSIFPTLRDDVQRVWDGEDDYVPVWVEDDHETAVACAACVYQLWEWVRFVVVFSTRTCTRTLERIALGADLKKGDEGILLRDVSSPLIPLPGECENTEFCMQEHSVLKDATVRFIREFVIGEVGRKILGRVCGKASWDFIARIAPDQSGLRSFISSAIDTKRDRVRLNQADSWLASVAVVIYYKMFTLNPIAARQDALNILYRSQRCCLSDTDK